MIGNFKKLPSDSSASRTAHSPLPNFALFLIEFITPPLIIVGSSFASDKIFTTNDVVVVFTCEPVIMIFFLSDTIFANILALSKIGSFFPLAAFISKLFFLIAEDLTIIVAFEILLLLWPINILIPIFLQLSVFLFLEISLPWIAKPIIFIIWARPLIPMPPIPIKWMISLLPKLIFFIEYI